MYVDICFFPEELLFFSLSLQSAVSSGVVLVSGSKEMFCFLKFLFDPATRSISAEDPGCRNIQGLTSPSSNLSELDNKGKNSRS